MQKVQFNYFGYDHEQFQIKQINLCWGNFIVNFKINMTGWYKDIKALLRVVTMVV